MNSKNYFVPVPYDDNYVKLASCPEEVSYVNASRIKFPGISQEFLAASAPKPVSYKQFWHMIFQENVGLLVSSDNLLKDKSLGACNCDVNQVGGE